MKKKPVSISDGKLKSYEDPLRRLAPIDKERGDRGEPEKDTGENEILKREKQEKKFSKDDMIYSERRAFRIKSFLISIVLGAVAYHVYFLSPVFAPLSNYFFLRMFFLGIGRSVQKQRRLKASRVILYTVILGLQLVSIFGALISYYTNNEEMLGLYFVVAIVLWLQAIIVAVFNKIQVNVQIGRSVQKQRRLKASLVILYTVILGLQLVFIFGELISYYTNNEEMLGLYFVVAIVLWLLAIVIAVFNKIQVNVHNQD